MENDKQNAPNVDTYRSVSIDRLSEDEKQVIIEAIKIARITAIGDKHQNFKLAAHNLKYLLEMFEGANEVWLTKSSSRLKSR